MLFRVVAFDYLYTSISNLCKLDGSHYESRVSFVYKPAFFSLTRLALASVLGPFGVHLLTFTIPGALMHYCFAVGTERPKSKRSMKFSVGLPQPEYAFVRDMSVLKN